MTIDDMNLAINENNSYANCDKWGFLVTKRWFVGCTGCTLQTLYAWLVRDLYGCMVGILIYRVLRLSLRCESWHATMLLI